tara:strand:- start:73 stop:552 length:480 start_codon:yes stop_codon:yes gene_type:complete
MFYLNDEKMGLYSFMEAVDQEYIFHRSFPAYDPTNFSLFKVKTHSAVCSASWTESETVGLEAATSETTFLFERGEHRPPFPSSDNFYVCGGGFFGQIGNECTDAMRAFALHDYNYGEFVVEEGLIDRDLGQSSWDGVMKDFANEHLGGFKCDGERCENR